MIDRDPSEAPNDAPGYDATDVASASVAKAIARSQKRTTTCGSDQPERWKW